MEKDRTKIVFTRNFKIFPKQEKSAFFVRFFLSRCLTAKKCVYNIPVRKTPGGKHDQADMIKKTTRAAKNYRRIDYERKTFIRQSSRGKRNG